MANYRNVLIPLDLALGSGFLSPAVRGILDFQEVEITLLHVVEAQPWMGRNAQTMRTMSELELFAHRQFRGARINRRIEWGRPADCILRAIDTAGADIVLLSAGRANGSNQAIGAVAAEVLAEAPCPVAIEWAVNAPVNRARVHPVCCALVFDGNEEAVLGEAVWAASRMRAPLKVLGALVPEGARSAILWDPDERVRASAALQRKLEAFCGSRAPGAEVHVGVGMAAPVISRALRFHGAGLLVTGGAADAPLAAESECPVLYIGDAKRRRAGNPAGSPRAEFRVRKTA
ncbi:MAG: universal stress protein [Candidatus Solibacter sp.]